MSDGAQTSLAAALRRVLPAGVAVAATDTAGTHPPLAEAERSATTSMAAQRLAEFTAGRACARAALRELRLPAAGIPVGQHREPLWPVGVVGSISHSRQLAVAALAPGTVLHAIGVDIEPELPLDADLIRRICRPSEVDRLGTGTDAALRAKAVFSAKESVYKCLWPVIGVFLEFADVEIVGDSTGTGFQVIGWGPLRGRSWAHLAGRLTVAAGHIVAVTYISALPNSGPGPGPGSGSAPG